jgi:hypothetical protein
MGRRASGNGRSSSRRLNLAAAPGPRFAVLMRKDYLAAKRQQVSDAQPPLASAPYFVCSRAAAGAKSTANHSRVSGEIGVGVQPECLMLREDDNAAGSDREGERGA